MTERKRARGFALMDAAFAADPKFLRLQRRAETPTDYAAAVGVFWIIVADARRTRSPSVNWDDFEEYLEQIKQLQAVGLLNEEGFDPEVFERWAPAYQSPYDRSRTAGTQGYAREHNGTEKYTASDQVISPPLSNGGEGVGEGGRQVFMGFRPRDPEGGAGLWHGQGLHDGRHGKSCMVCAPLLEEKS